MNILNLAADKNLLEPNLSSKKYIYPKFLRCNSLDIVSLSGIECMKMA